MSVLRLAFLFAVLFAFATSAHAQATGSDCSTADQPTKTWNQQPPDPLCTGSIELKFFNVYSTTVDTCTNNNTGAVYAQSARQTYGIGYWDCGPSNLINTKCNPNITQEVTHATSPTDYNRFYLRAWDVNPAQFCTLFVTMSRQDFWQCQGVGCPTGGGGGGCTGNGTPTGAANRPRKAPTGPRLLLAQSPTTPTCPTSPIIIDTTGNGFVLTSAANGVVFNFSGGQPIQTAWTAASSANAFLCLPDPNGRCDDGADLFGNFTPQPPSNNPNGFAALAVYDLPANGGNGDGVIDARDAIFASLRLWIDKNHDGISQPEELFTLPSLGVNSISLNYKADGRTDQYGNIFRYRAQVNPGGPNTGITYDVFFVTSQPTSNNIARTISSDDTHKCAVPLPAKGGMLPATSTTLR